MPVRAVRGATSVARDERDHVLEVTRELPARVMEVNGLKPGDFVRVILTATPDVRSVAPALAARQIGFDDIAVLCLQEPAAREAGPR